MQLIVTADKLNKRKSVPQNLPEPAGIAGVVNKGYTFEGNEADATEVPNAALGKWYKDRDNNFYWGGGVTQATSGLSSITKLDIIPTLDISSSEPNSPWLNFLGIAEIWKITKGELVNVAVLDTGINSQNSELVNSVFPSTNNLQSCKNLTDNSNNVTDQFGHGTMCSSLVSFENNSIIVGIAPSAKLFVGKISIMGEMSGYQLMADGITWAADVKEIDIISISFGQNQEDASFADFKKAIDYALSKNKIIVAAIGDKENNPDPVYPALFENCISVAACDTSGNPWNGNADWDKTTIYAPGIDITTYVVKNVYFPDGDIKTYKLSGTSQATAITSGVLALIVSYFKSKGLSYNNESIKNILTSYFSPLQTDKTKKVINPLKIFSNI